ncbi:MAG: MFS transporter [Rhodomicrobium sp.]
MEEALQPSQRSLRGLDWFTFFLGDIQTGFGPFISVYLVTQKWNQTDIGLVLSIGALASLLSQIPAGALIDAVRSERSAAAAAVLAIGVSAFVIAVLPIFLAVAAARALQSMASALLGPAIAAISLGLVGRHSLSARLGRNARFASAGNGAAAALMGACGHFLSAQAVFFVTAGFAVPALAALAKIREGEVNAASAHGGVCDERTSGIMPGLRVLLQKRTLWVFAGVIILFQMANTPMLPLAGSELTMQASHSAVALVAICIVLPQLIVALFSPWVGRLARSVGRRPLLLVALGVLPVRGLLFAVVTGPSSIVAVQMLDGVSASVLGVLIPLVIADIAYGTGHFNLAQGLIGMAVGLAAAISTSAAGYVADRFGQHAAFLSLAGTAASGFLLLTLLMPETRPSDE